MIFKIANFKPVNKIDLKNNQHGNYCFNHSLTCDTVSFGNTSPILKAMLAKNQKENSDYSKIVSDFGCNILKYGDKLTPELLESEIQNFLNFYNIKNIDIKALSELSFCPVTTPGGYFSPQLNGDLNGIKNGTIYIGNMPDSSDKDAMTVYIAFVCHELTHALQYSNDKSKFGFENEISSFDEAKPIFGTINTLKGKIIPMLQCEPLNYLSINYKDFGLTKQDIYTLQDAIDNYHMPILNKPINLSTNFIEKSFSKDIPFKSLTENIADAAITNHIDKYKKHYGSISKNKEVSLRKALLKRFIYEFKTEAEAYKTSCEILKKQYNIQGNIVYDMVPETYKMIEDILSEKLKAQEL